MLSRRTVPVLIGICLLSGMFLMGQDHVLQNELCDPDPCVDIPNAVPGECSVVPGGWGPDDFACMCSPGYAWDPATHTCQGVIPVESNLPDTGITKCYNGTSVIPCPALGQPFYGQDAQYSSNPMSYTDHGNGTVTDNVTGLVWQQCSAGLSGSACSSGTATGMTWDDAIAYCEDLNLAGHTDWRLPVEYALQSIVDYGRYNPAIDTTVFPGTKSWGYWSSSRDASWFRKAWLVGFHYGYVFNYSSTLTYHVRCVRGEMTPPPSFTDNGDGTVADNETGLVWQQQDDGVSRNWKQGLAYCQDLDLGGATDWRLPDIKELRSIVDNTRYYPAIDTTVFPGTSLTYYWSSSTYAPSTYYAWSVLFFYNGRVFHYHKALTNYVRCVR